MRVSAAGPDDVDAYIAGFEPSVQALLRDVRAAIRTAIPEARETIKYGMPTYVLNGNVVSFGAYKKHIGLYPVPRGDEAFERDIARYRAARSSLRLPLDEPVPASLIERMVRLLAVRPTGG